MSGYNGAAVVRGEPVQEVNPFPFDIFLADPIYAIESGETPALKRLVATIMIQKPTKPNIIG